MQYSSTGHKNNFIRKRTQHHSTAGDTVHTLFSLNNVLQRCNLLNSIRQKTAMQLIREEGRFNRMQTLITVSMASSCEL